MLYYSCDDDDEDLEDDDEDLEGEVADEMETDGDEDSNHTNQSTVYMI